LGWAEALLTIDTSGKGQNKAAVPMHICPCFARFQLKQGASFTL